MCVHGTLYIHVYVYIQCTCMYIVIWCVCVCVLFCSESHESSEAATDPVTVPSLPPIPLEQLDTAIGMLVRAIQANHRQSHSSPFASRLLIMTLAFLTRLIRGQALLEEEDEEEEEENERENGEKMEAAHLGESGV